MKKFYFSLCFIFLLLSCTTPQDNDDLLIKIIEEGLEIEISANRNNNLSNSMKGGSTNNKEKIVRKEFDDKASLYCSQFKKRIGNPVFYKGIGYYKCIEFN
jgi:hypothetical protein